MNQSDLRTRTFQVRSAAAFALGVLLFASGCRNTTSALPPSDASLTQQVKGRLSSDSAIAAEPIETSVQQGVATLNGTVSSAAARSLAANEAAQISGIRTVVNNLVVQAAATPAAVSAPPVAPSAPIRTEGPARYAKPSALVTPPTRTASPAATSQETATTTPAPIERIFPQPGTHAPLVTPAAAFRTLSLPQDTTLPVRITQTLDSASTQPGETFAGVLSSDLLSDGVVVLPRGTPVSGRVIAVQEAAHFKGSSLLTIELTSLDVRGDHIPITTDSFRKAGNGRGKNSAEKIGGGAAVGAILGGIFGGGKGAAIGAAAGGGAGAGVQAITKGQQVQIESETVVSFRLTNPISVRFATGSQPSDTHDGSNLRQHN